MTSSMKQPDAPRRFGGWSDYREWAEHDFRQRTSAEEPMAGGRRTFVVEALSELLPITLPAEAEADSEHRTACSVHGGHDDHYEADAVLTLDEESALVRPYVRADGRSEVVYELGFETMVSAARPYASLPLRELSEDQRWICRLCEVPQSVAEVAVAIAAPIGVTRTLISHSIDQGYLQVHETVSMVNGLPSMELLKRVREGLLQHV
ncbi:DUF742 domain-containing protein [Amycolatopsis sp. NPDC058986]|uniref:DUF742 domain-containing protein n=1 Tax=unclassified Amycolatopsis TaxID=2618356 RepID=UPI0036722CCF